MAQARDLTYASDYYAYGNDLADTGKYQEALSAFQTARSMDSRFYDEHFGISYQIGWVLNKLGRYDEALTEFQKTEDLHPEWINPYAVYVNEGTLLTRLGRYDEALIAFDKALTYSYSSWYALIDKGILLGKMGREQEAVDAFETSRKAYGSYLPLLGTYEEAASVYITAEGERPQTATRISPDANTVSAVSTLVFGKDISPELLLKQGADYLAQYKFADAAKTYDKALLQSPGEYRALHGKGIALANLGEYEEALPVLNQTLLYLDYRKHEDMYVDTWYAKGWVLAKMGAYDESITCFDKLLAVNPDVFRARYNKGWVLARQGRYTESAKEYDRSLDWERQVGNEHSSYTILNPQGTYQDIAGIYRNLSRNQVMRGISENSKDIVIYQTDFSDKPDWQTSRPNLYFWDKTNKTYHFKSETNLGYAEVLIPYKGTAFRFEYDIIISHSDPGTSVKVGLTQFNTSENTQEIQVSYNSQNAILSEFKSWRAGSYRNLKDGDKTFQVLAINSNKRTTSPDYDGLCRLNREQDPSVRSFGDNRIYHIIGEFDPEKQIISGKVTDNLHEKTFFDCSGMYSKVGTFNNINRIILVAEPAENAYIEGYIDNVKLYETAGFSNSADMKTKLSDNQSGQGGILPGIFPNAKSSGSITIPVFVITGVFAVIVYQNRKRYK